jgi:hypothetical protein
MFMVSQELYEEVVDRSNPERNENPPGDHDPENFHAQGNRRMSRFSIEGRTRSEEVRLQEVLS